MVQGRLPVLDSSESTDAFSPYARSKVAGEVAARAEGPEATTVYRPPSVHAPTRRVTRQLTRHRALSPGHRGRPGDRPTPQTHIRDVADAIVLLCTSTNPPPPVVHHPWQGHTTAGLLRMLGDGRSPRLLPNRPSEAGAPGGRGSLTDRPSPRALRASCGDDLVRSGPGPELADGAGMATSHDRARLGRRSATWPAARHRTPPRKTDDDQPADDLSLQRRRRHDHRWHRLLRVDDGPAPALPRRRAASTSSAATRPSRTRCGGRLDDARVRFFVGDVRDYDSVANAVIGADFVFHAAALKQVPSCEFFPEQAVKTNVIGQPERHRAPRSGTGCAPSSASAPTRRSTRSTRWACPRRSWRRPRRPSPATTRTPPTTVSVTRYGNVMYSRGSVIPLFVAPARGGPAAHRHRAHDDPLPHVAGRVGRPGRARVPARRSPATCSSARRRPARSRRSPRPSRGSARRTTSRRSSTSARATARSCTRRCSPARRWSRPTTRVTTSACRSTPAALEYERLLRRGRAGRSTRRRLRLRHHRAARTSSETVALLLAAPRDPGAARPAGAARVKVAAHRRPTASSAGTSRCRLHAQSEHEVVRS